MKRRHVCRLLAGFGAGIAGCTSRSEPTGPSTPPQSPTPTPTPTPTPKPGVDIDGRTVEPGPDGNLVFVLELRNTAEGRRRATYVVTAESASNDFSVSKEKTVELAGGGRTTVEFTFDIAFDEWAADGSIDFQRKKDAE